ncbi:MAG: DUF507 family protein [Acidobacteria bacterium]|jgi:hypothetical protein|nr:DUF507 family protein [Acidobacteriota bacterium]
MRLPPPLIDLLARGLLRQLQERRVIACDHPRAAEEKVARLITEDLRIDDELTEEARLALVEHQKEMAENEMEYGLLVTRVKAQLAAKRGYITGTGPGKLPRDKAQDLAARITRLFLQDPDVEYFVKEQELRASVLRAIEDEMRRDALREEKARQKVRSIKRNIPEESGEFHALFQQFYRELIDRGL